MALLARKQAPFVSIPTKVRLHTLFRGTLHPKHCEPQTMLREFSGLSPVLDKSPILHLFPYFPILKILFICVNQCSSVVPRLASMPRAAAMPSATASTTSPPPF